MESLKAQLAEANERINKLSADVHDKRGVAYKHHTLEELRNIQEQVQREKAVMAIQRERELTDLSVERTLLEDQRKQFEKDQVKREPGSKQGCRLLAPESCFTAQTHSVYCERTYFHVLKIMYFLY